ncbi:MAG: family 43 glycosylhydrolase, partial [Tannerella sp.]|nr:family 43 glycosylhydrolase [Tannerella sp.]
MCAIILFPHILSAQLPYTKKTAALMTPWGEALQATDPVLPEYPRPQMVREKWLNLNGIWQFQPAASATEALPAGNLSREILVPFPVESALSGIMEQHENVWYRRSFTVPEDWAGQQVLLHFGAVDYTCEVFINRESIGTHQGGYDPFSFDITDKLTGAGAQDIALRVSDPTDAKGYPRGKQTLYPGGIMYTSTTGIWQTVWIEPVPQNYAIADFRMVPDIDNAVLKFYPAVRGKYRFKIYDRGTEIADWEKDISGSSAGADLAIPQPIKLWSPDSPFLYDMKVFRINGTEIVDSVSTYFGMRKISKQLVDGYQRMMLNNRFLFQMGPLDQGFWPDGIYTAPTDEALRFDIEKIKELGFNMVRKHIKVEPQRWYYWCDKLGIMVWQDMPSMNSYINTNEHPVPAREDAAFKRELEAMIKTHRNSPAIVSWVIFNEYQGSHNENTLADQVKSLDNSRLVNINSGVNDTRYDTNSTDVRDYHNYAPPVAPPKNTANTQALVCGEYGGVGYYEQGHFWSEGNPYATVNSYAELLERYTEYANMLIDFKSNKGLSAAVYTEITDVEMELNGLITYDREVLKGYAKDFYDVNRRIINEYRYYTTIAPTSEETPQTWKYTTTQPAANWFEPVFNDAGWTTGNGGFGTENTPGAVVGTIWNSTNIWLRRTFTLPAQAIEQATLILRLHHDEDCRIYINGVKALEQTGYTSGYAYYSITPEAQAALVPDGENVLAVYCYQTNGGQYIDVGVSTMILTGSDENDAYSNPVVAQSLPDPTVIRADDGYFYLYATENIRNIPIYRSIDLVDWTFQGTAFTDASRPTFEPDGGLWAPDINFINGKYVLYYSMSVWGGEQTCGIGVATSDSPQGPFTDLGKLFRSSEIGVRNSIDPFYIEENGKKYLFWGSFHGIYYVELSDDGLALKYPDNPQPQQVAGTAFEGTYIYKRGDYYYLFASVGSCCEGLNSTYQLVAGRSASLFGPYVNKQGNSMMSNAYAPVVGFNNRFVGNGHCSEIVRDDAGSDWMLFHGWDVTNAANGRILLLNQIKWENGWPYVNGESPALSGRKPEWSEATAISLSGSDAITPCGGYIQLTAKAEPQGALLPAIRWSVDNEAIARITETGKLYAIANGTVTVTATAMLAGGATLTTAKPVAITGQNAGDYSFTVMGSSVPWGQGADPREVNGYAWLWTTYLQNNALHEWTTDNISIGGNTTTDVINRWDSDLLPSCSRYVYYGLSLGNEGIHERGQTAFDSWRDNMLLLIKRTRDHGKIPLVGNNYPRGDFNDVDYAFLKQLNLLIHEWDVPSVNLLGAIDNDAGRWASGYMADNAHPNTAGHAEMFYALTPSLLDALADGKPQPVRNGNVSLTLTKTNPVKRIAFTPENILHSFTLAFAFKTTGTGTVASFVTAAGDTARLTLGDDGKLTYKSQTSAAALNDDAWHT